MGRCGFVVSIFDATKNKSCIGFVGFYARWGNGKTTAAHASANFAVSARVKNENAHGL